MKAAATPSKRNLLSTLIAKGDVTPVREFVNKYKVPKSAVNEAYAAVDYGVMAGEPSPQLKKRENVEKLLNQSQPLVQQLLKRFGIGGKHKNRKNSTKRKAKKLTIPPVIAEQGIEILAEIAVGGNRRKTRKNK